MRIQTGTTTDTATLSAEPVSEAAALEAALAARGGLTCVYRGDRDAIGAFEGADPRIAGAQRRKFGTDVEICFLNTDCHGQPPVTGGKKAISSPSATAVSAVAMF